jgi:hypothetical protein
LRAVAAVRHSSRIVWPSTPYRFTMASGPEIASAPHGHATSPARAEPLEQLGGGGDTNHTAVNEPLPLGMHRPALRVLPCPGSALQRIQD